MASPDDVTIRLKLKDARQFQTDAKESARSLDSIGTAAKAANTSVKFVSKGFENAGRSISQTSSNILRNLRYVSTGAVAGLTGALAAGAKAGLSYNSMLEQQTIKFTSLLGSRSKALKEMSTLQQLAFTTPFHIEDVTDATSKMVSFGMSVESANRTIRDFGDAGAALGLDPGRLQEATLAVNQIQSVGALRGQELNQLEQSGITTRTRLAQALGLSGADLAAAMKQGLVTSDMAISALQSSIETRYKGMGKRLSQTFSGQLSNLGDQFNALAGKMTKPLFDALEKDVLPRASTFMGRLNDIFSNKPQADVMGRTMGTNLTMAQKLQAAWNEAKFEFGPLVNNIMAALRKVNWNRRLSDLVAFISPYAAKAFAALAPIVFHAFWTGFKALPWEFQLLAVAKLLSVFAGKAGVFDLVGSLAGAAFKKLFLRTAVTGAATEMAAGVAAESAGFAAVGTSIAALIGPAMLAALVAYLDYRAIKKLIHPDTAGLDPKAERQHLNALAKDPTQRGFTPFQMSRWYASHVDATNRQLVQGFVNDNPQYTQYLRNHGYPNIRTPRTRKLDVGGGTFGLHKADGGLVPGAGTGDIVPAMLTPGEFVLRRQAVRRFGPSLLSELNSGNIASRANQPVVVHIEPQEIAVQIDGKNVGKAVYRYTSNELARGVRGA